MELGPRADVKLTGENINVTGTTVNGTMHITNTAAHKVIVKDCFVAEGGKSVIMTGSDADDFIRRMREKRLKNL